MTQPACFDINGKTAFITGAASGIGLATALRFRNAGATVVAVDRQPLPAELAVPEVHYIALDISERDAVEAAFAEAERRVGKLDIVINNAGRGSQGKHITDSDPALFDKTMQVNAYGLFYCLKYAPAHMNDGGSIINTASVAGLQQNEGFHEYSASKAAVISLSKTAAVELGLRGIRVNAVAPGPIRTPLLPEDSVLNKLARNLSAVGRIGEVDDLAGVYHFLAADESAYITGQTIAVDGGRLAGFRREVLNRLE